MDSVLQDRTKPCVLPSQTDSGYALVLVIWLFGIMGLLVSTVAWNARSKVQATRNIAESIKAEALADGAVSLVKLAVISSLNDQQGGRRGAFAEIVAGGFVVCQAPGGMVAVSVENEAGKIDLNAASAETLASLLKWVGAGDVEAGRLSLTIKKYSQRYDSTKRAEKSNASDRRRYSVPPKQAPFETIFELDQVEGMRRELFEALLPYVTVYSGRSDPDLSVAPLQLLTAPFLTGLVTETPSANAARYRFSPAARADVRVAEGDNFLIHVEAATVGGGIFAREETLGIVEDINRLHTSEWRRGRMRHIDAMKKIPAGSLTWPECGEGWR